MKNREKKVKKDAVEWTARDEFREEKGWKSRGGNEGGRVLEFPERRRKGAQFNYIPEMISKMDNPVCAATRDQNGTSNLSWLFEIYPIELKRLENYER